MKPPFRERAVDFLLMLVIVSCLLILAGCSATGGALTVNKAVPVACDQIEPEKPAMPTDDLRKGANVEQYVRAARAERQVRIGYEDRLVTALRACIKPIEPQAKVN